jgi:hypothetical protein
MFTLLQHESMDKKLIPKLGKSFEMASSWLKWFHLCGLSTNYALSWIRRRKLAFNLSITSREQDISAKQFLDVNLRGVFDIVAAISAQGSHFETFAQLRDQFLTVSHTLRPRTKCIYSKQHLTLQNERIFWKE